MRSRSVFVHLKFVLQPLMPIQYAGPGITRLDLPEVYRYGYMVRICRNGEKHSAFFSDRKFGGKRNAKKAAQAQYAEFIEKYGPTPREGTRNKLTARNSTGIVGVHIAETVDHRWSGAIYKAYCAAWVDEEGRRKKIAFSWDRYGKNAALEMARYARQHLTTNRAAIVKAVEAKLKRRAVKKKRT
jgi:hypothetical protein